MNVLWGLDVPFYIAHSTGLHLGNYARNDGNGDDGSRRAGRSPPHHRSGPGLVGRRSIRTSSTIRERAMIMSARARVAWS